MLRSFCLGALAGFFLGSSKTGTMMRSRVDGFFSEFLGDAQAQLKLAEDGDELSDESENTRGNGRKLSEVGGGRRQSARGGSAEHKLDNMEKPKSKSSRPAKQEKQAEPAHAEKNDKSHTAKQDGKAKHEAELAQPQKKENDTAHGEGKLPMDKAVELAEKLSAKPTTPPDEEAPAMKPEN